MPTKVLILTSRTVRSIEVGPPPVTGAGAFMLKAELENGDRVYVTPSIADDLQRAANTELERRLGGGSERRE